MESQWFQSSSWDAFISQSAIYSSDYDFLSRSDDTVSLDMWEAGLLLTTTVINNLAFSAQLLGRHVSEFSGEDIRLDYAFFSYPLYQSMDRSLGVRLGRIRSSYGFYNETRDIPHTRRGIIMPQTVYFDMTRNSFYSADGIELFGAYDLEDQQLSFQLFFSRPVIDEDEAQNVSSLSPRDLKGDKSILAKIAYGSEYDGLRASFTYYRPEYDVGVSVPVSQAPVVIVSEDNASFYSENMVTSLEYNQLKWSVTLEYLRHKYQTTIPVRGPDAVNASYEEAYYVQGVYRFNEHWENYVRYEQTKIRGANEPRLSFDDASLGLAFRPDEHWLFRTEVHYIEGLSRLFSRDNTFNSSQDPYWSAAMFQIAYKW